MVRRRIAEICWLLAGCLLLASCTTRMQAASALRSGDTAQAVALYTQAVENHPDSLSLRTELGWALLQDARYARAEAECQEALARDQAGLGAAREAWKAELCWGAAQVAQGQSDAGYERMLAVTVPHKYRMQQDVEAGVRKLRAENLPPDELIPAVQKLIPEVEYKQRQRDKGDKTRR